MLFRVHKTSLEGFHLEKEADYNNSRAMVKRIQKARLFPLQSINVIHVSLFEYIQVQQQSSTKNWEQVSKNIR